MHKNKKELIKDVVYRFAELSKITDTKMCDDFIEKLSNLDIDDSIDTILVSLNSLLNRNILSIDDILSNVNLILSLKPDKYHSAENLISRLNWIKGMNLEYPQMPLTENHKLVLEAFDKFNELIGTSFDCFYTGGLMGYLATNHSLERYHSDLDLFINEDQLLDLYSLVQNSADFRFVSNMGHKEKNGHEFKITYRDTPMSIGLFLFSRLPNNEMVLKEYFYPEQDKNNELVVNENHIKGEYATMLFSNTPREHNGKTYKAQSLEGIYHSKIKGRPKDRYDANLISEYVDQEIVRKLDVGRSQNYGVNNKKAEGSVVEKLDRIINEQDIKRKSDIGDHDDR